MAVPAEESAWSKKYKKQMEEKMKKADDVLEEHPDNKVAKHIKASTNRRLNEDSDKPEAKTWEFVDSAYYAARDIYMDGEASLDEALKELIDALDVCRSMATEKGEAGKTKNPRGKQAKENKELAKEIGY